MINEEDKITLTHENLHACANGGCGFTMAQVEMLGHKWPPTKGWVKGVIGDVVTVSFYEEFKAAGKIRAGALRRMKRAAAQPKPEIDLFCQHDDLLRLHPQPNGEFMVTNSQNVPLTNAELNKLARAVKFSRNHVLLG